MKNSPRNTAFRPSEQNRRTSMQYNTKRSLESTLLDFDTTNLVRRTERDDAVKKISLIFPVSLKEDDWVDMCNLS